MKHGHHYPPEHPPGRWIALGVGAGVLLGIAITWTLAANSGSSPTTVGLVGSPPATTPSIAAPDQRRARALSAEAAGRGGLKAAVFPDTSPVLLLGDSLAVGIGSYVDAGLGDRSFSMAAAEGRSTATSVSLLAPVAQTAPMTWVVSLGTNDNPEEFMTNAEAVMQLAGDKRCVVWFDVWRLDTDTAINASLGELAASHSNLHLIAWHDTSRQHPGWFSGADVHPSSDGYAVRGQLAVDAVNQMCTDPPKISFP